MKICRPFLLAAALAACATPAAADLVTGLIAHYHLDGNGLDSGPFANHGSPNGSVVATTDRFGTAASACEFNGTNSFITVPNSASLSSPTTAITMSAWVQVYGNSLLGSPFSPILMKSTEGGNAFMYRFLAAPTYFGSAYRDWNTHQSAAATLPPTEWHHLATTYNGSRHRFYLDGVQVSDQALTVTMTADTRPLTIGADYPGIFEVFRGKIDDVRIYNRALDDAEVAQLFAGTVGVGDPELPERLAIRRAYPSPARGQVTLEFSLAEGAAVELAVHDVSGRRIRALSPGALPAGTHSVRWDGRTASGEAAGAGLYFVILRTARAEAVTRVVRIE